MNRESQSNVPETVGCGYIAIPEGLERADFIETCYRRGRVTIITEYGAVINECYITADVLQQIDFPIEVGGKGSCVAFISAKFTTKPIIIGVILTNDESSMLKEHQYRIRKVVEGTDIVLQFDPDNKTVLLNVSSKDAAKIDITVKGNEEDELNIQSSGSVNITSDKSINSKSYETITSSIVDVEKEEDLHTLTWDKTGVVITRKNEKSENVITLTDEETSLVRTTESIKETVKLSDDGIFASTKDNMKILLNNTDLQITTGQSTLKMNNDIIDFNGGGLDGLVKINEITSKLNSFVSTFNSHIHMVPAATFLVAATAGVPNPAPMPVQTTQQQAQQFNKRDYENEKIVQG